MPAFDDPLMLTGLGILLMAGFMAPFFLSARRRERETDEAEAYALRYGLNEPATLHPVVDVERCMGIGNCVSVCPEGVLGFRDGQAVAVSAAKCVGHGLCERVCPVDAIKLVFGTATRGVDIPRVRENFETNVPGIYVIGELGGMGLIRNAFEQGRQCVEGIRSESRASRPDLLEAVVVGCGPAGLSASLHLKRLGLRFVTLEKEDVGGTVRHYPRKKLVMTEPVKVPGFGRIGAKEIRKESLIDTWVRIVDEAELPVRTRETVQAVERRGDRLFTVVTDTGRYETARVILAIGRRGVPRKLGVPGEDSPKVSYSLGEPEAYANDRILVVGGGDSAVEAAMALAEQPGNHVKLSYRRDRFGRIKQGNRERIGTFLESGGLDVIWSSNLVAIDEGFVHVERTDGSRERLPNDQVFVFAGGELPTRFLRDCGIEIDTKFGEP